MLIILPITVFTIYVYETEWVIIRRKWLWKRKVAFFKSCCGRNNAGEENPREQFGFGNIISNPHIDIVDTDAGHVEEKIGKYFGYLARCEANFLYIDPSKSKFCVKI